MNPALIPLHARSGPNLELHTTNGGALQWLQRKLAGAIWLNEDEEDVCQSIQCPVGLLVSIDSSTIRRPGMGTFTSDCLIFGVLSSVSSSASPPTPPRSSPHDTNTQAIDSPVKKYEMRIYAAPLSMSLVEKAQAYPSPPSSSVGDHISTQAEFLPDITSPSPKRKRVATLFEVAAQHHRRVWQRGGEAVSQMMAPSRPFSSSQNIRSLRVKCEPDDEPSNNPGHDRSAARRSRSISASTNLHRSSSTRGARAIPDLNIDPQKDATLDPKYRRASQHIETLPSLSSSVEHQKSSARNSPPRDSDTVIAENKNLIIRTVLTCMRLYGFHRSNTRSSTSNLGQGGSGDPEAVTRSSTPVPEGLRTDTLALTINTATDDEEFKNLYHATYKAAAFALRKYLKESAPPLVLEKSRAMSCIDKLLRTFCEDY